MFSLMFSGIIEELGEIKKISRQNNITLLEVAAVKASEDIVLGDSVALNGVCLTVVKRAKNSLSFEVMPESLSLSNLGRLKIGDKVNLERALKIGGRLSGHFVTGHIDCIGLVRKKNYINGNLSFEICLPAKFIGFIFPKGAIAIDGISLTVVNKKSNTFTVYVIPQTSKNTTLSFKGPSCAVNIEIDILARYNQK